MAPLHVVVTTNQFRVGGRETFVGTYLRALKEDGATASLLCSALDEQLPETALFDSIAVCPASGRASNALAWLERGRELTDGRSGAVLWAHHFDLLPAWLLSRVAQVPLVTSFHGPLVGAGRPNDLLEALGMTLAIHRGDALTGVSPEVLDGIAALRTAVPSTLTPNSVDIALADGTPRPWPPRRLLLVTRDEKLGHVRAAVRFFAAYRRRVPGARLRVVAGGFAREAAHPAAGWLWAHFRRGLRALGARWCWNEGAAILASLPFVEWSGYRPDVRRLMRASDLVLGMGRVVLEALAESRPALLVGYDQLHGCVTPETLALYGSSNFSGRAVPAARAEECADRLLLDEPELPDIAPYATPACAPALEALLRSTRFDAPPGDRTLATQVPDALVAGGPSGLFRVLCQALHPLELETLYRLSAG
jgi:hypothetical protein